MRLKPLGLGDESNRIDRGGVPHAPVSHIFLFMIPEAKCTSNSTDIPANIDARVSRITQIRLRWYEEKAHRCPSERVWSSVRVAKLGAGALRQPSCSHGAETSFRNIPGAQLNQRHRRKVSLKVGPDVSSNDDHPTQKVEVDKLDFQSDDLLHLSSLLPSPLQASPVTSQPSHRYHTMSTPLPS